MKRKGFTRREAVLLTTGAVAAAALPASRVLSAAEAASIPKGIAEPVEIDSLSRLVAHQQEPAWALWQATAREFAPLLSRATELAASRDMDELLAFRLGEDVIAFDMASRRITRLAETTLWSQPRNEAERAIKARAEFCE